MQKNMFIQSSHNSVNKGNLLTAKAPIIVASRDKTLRFYGNNISCKYYNL